MPTTIQYLSLFLNGDRRASAPLSGISQSLAIEQLILRVGRHQVKPLDVGFIDNTANGVVVHANMKAELLIDEHYVLDEIVVWRLDRPVRGSTHRFKYRLALVADSTVSCVTTMKRGKVIIGTLVVLKSAIPS